MGRELRILILEDTPTDAELMERELRTVDIAFTSKRVETEEAFSEALHDFAPDLILADYNLPSFDGVSALAIAREKCPDVPFIFVSATIGEELAIECLKNGATGYILKDRLARLAPAVERALSEAESQAQRRRAEESLLAAAREWETTFNSMEDAVAIVDEKSNILRCNRAMVDLVGKSQDEIMGRPCYETIHGADKPVEGCPMVRMRRTRQRETMLLSTNGRWLEACVDPILDGDGKLTGAVHVIADITERKRAEERMRYFEMAVDSSTDAIGLSTPEGKHYYQNKVFDDLFGLNVQVSLPKIRFSLV